MKTIILLFGTSFIISCAQAQNLKDAEVPQALKTKLHALYPSATDVKWEKEKGDFEVGFKNGKEEISVIMDAKGNVKETEAEIVLAALPIAITDYVKKNFASYSLAEAAKTIDAKKVVSYEAEVKNDNETLDLIFDEKGNFLKKVVEKDADKEKD